MPDRRVQDAVYLNDTTFVVTWSGNGPQTGDFKGRYGRLGSSNSGMIGPNLYLSDDRPTESYAGLGKVTANKFTGDFMMAWTEASFQTPKLFLLGRVFSQSGPPKTPSVILTADTLYEDLWAPAIQWNSNTEEYIIAWPERRATSWYIKLKRVDENGVQIGMIETVNPDGNALSHASLDIAIDTNGDFLVVWENIENDRSRIYGQRYLSDGAAIGTNFRISVFPDTAEHYFPSIALHAKKIYVAWGVVHTTLSIPPQAWGKVLDFDNPVSTVERPPVSTPKGFVLYNNYPKGYVAKAGEFRG